TAVRSIRAKVDDYFRQPLSKNQIIKRPIRSIYAAASGFIGSCSSALANLVSSSCTIRAVCALYRMWVSNAPSAIPNISIPSNKRTSGAELTIDTVYQQSCCCFQIIQVCSEIGTNHALARILNVYEHRNLLTLFGFWNGM